VRSVLICALDPLTDELHGTLLWRDGIERHVAASFEEALTIAVAAHPNLIAIDRDLPRSSRLIEDLRRDSSTRELSIVVIARGEMRLGELSLLQAGANAILRLPPGPDWDARLSQLLNVSVRSKTRIPVRLEVEGSTGEIELFRGTARNLSVSGMLLDCEALLAIGTDLDFALALPTCKEPIVGCGHVVRRDAEGRFGVEFYGLEGDGAERVRSFVEG
jgi:CheY-like chemotaxis protein